MYDEDEDNDGKFPDESPVEVRYPRSKQEEQGDRGTWPRLPGSLVEKCSPDERDGWGAVRERAVLGPWPRLPGSIVEQCSPDEWYVCVEVRELAVLRDGRRAPRRTASRNLYYPCCFRDSSEIRPRTTPSSATSSTRRRAGR